MFGLGCLKLVFKACFVVSMLFLGKGTFVPLPEAFQLQIVVGKPFSQQPNRSYQQEKDNG